MQKAAAGKALVVLDSTLNNQLIREASVFDYVVATVVFAAMACSIGVMAVARRRQS
jgi:hypothetical protein